MDKTIPLSGSAALSVKFVMPAGFEKWNRALQGAYRKGYEAGAAGLGLDACPYEDKRKWNGRLTWSRSFQAAWRDGWDAGRLHNPITAYYADRSRSGDSAREARP